MVQASKLATTTALVLGLAIGTTPSASAQFNAGQAATVTKELPFYNIPLDIDGIASRSKPKPSKPRFGAVGSMIEGAGKGVQAVAGSNPITGAINKTEQVDRAVHIDPKKVDLKTGAKPWLESVIKTYTDQGKNVFQTFLPTEQAEALHERMKKVANPVDLVMINIDPKADKDGFFAPETSVAIGRSFEPHKPVSLAAAQHFFPQEELDRPGYIEAGFTKQKTESVPNVAPAAAPIPKNQ